jgi:hypothetical protein
MNDCSTRFEIMAPGSRRLTQEMARSAALAMPALAPFFKSNL